MSLIDVFLPAMPHYIYGTTRLGDESIPEADRVTVAKLAMQSAGWLHTSHQYGHAQHVLRIAAEELGSDMPPVICKIGHDSVEQVRDQIRLQNDALGIPTMRIGQLCLSGALAESFRTGSPLQDDLIALREEGIVDRFVLEMWPWNSDIAIGALKDGRPDDLIDAFIFYLNPLQRFVSNELWDLIQEKDKTIIAMRTTTGGSLTRLQQSESAPEYLRKRANEIAPIYERSGCNSWPEFCMRFIVSVPNVRATVGATSRPENLNELVSLSHTATPLAAADYAEIEHLQRKWSGEHDQFAAPWSM